MSVIIDDHAFASLVLIANLKPTIDSAKLRKPLRDHGKRDLELKTDRDRGQAHSRRCAVRNVESHASEMLVRLSDKASGHRPQTRIPIP